ncbi:MAG: hypothetical protein IPL84_14900 [Chitinophagaceae bacterium]|nr:hypothetical protein [Chitinophagaceae bacterium]
MADLKSYQEADLQNLFQSRHSLLAMEEELRLRGFTADLISEMLEKVKKKRMAKRQSAGFIYMAAGAFLGFLSCVFSIAGIFPDQIGFVLYGLTTIAVLLVVLGLYFVFE